MLIYKDNPFFDVNVARKLFEIHKDDLDDVNGFDELLQNTLFFNTYENGQFIGCVFVYEEGGKNWIGGYANRKNHKACVQALIEVCQMFDVVYAKTRHKTAVFCLKRAGFDLIDTQKGMLKRKRS